MVLSATTLLENIRKSGEEKIKTTLVEKDIDLSFDVGNLLSIDPNNLDEDWLK